MKQFSHIFFLFSLTLGVLACTEDDTADGPVIPTAELVAQNIQLADQGNVDNPSDIEVRFETPSQSGDVDRFSLFFAQVADTASVTEQLIDGFSAEQQTVVDNTESEHTLRLGADQTDALGKAFDATQSYIVYVASIGTFEETPFTVIAQTDAPFQLSEELLVQTLIPNFGASDGLFVASDGTIIASDFGAFDNDLQIGLGTKVLAVTPEGEVSEKASGFIAPMGGGMDSQGNFYFTHENGGDGLDGKVVRVTPDGSTAEIATLPGWPSGIAVDSNDNLYIANFAGPLLHKITPDGTVSVVAQDQRLTGCVGIDIDEDGNIITANFNDGSIYRVNAGTGTISLIAQIPDLVEFFAIGYITLFEGDIYATGIGDNKIFKVTMAGQISTLAGTGANGSNDGPVATATFSNPNGIAVDTAARRLYISQFGERALRFIQF
ncbi:hypothetical protein [Tunicatimonas pelagia]|uniref:hypothetical protein n=1 Tax=Tunicatimonas pelagia TaxID=931531 RepID=UPI0026669DB4|nr:hypothetical protein [Tunicatimonas pelagia]WKN43681.1 hypothetical protein P0M28_01690 [Tunicatimonas pelagia]